MNIHYMTRIFLISYSFEKNLYKFNPLQNKISFCSFIFVNIFWNVPVFENGYVPPQILSKNTKLKTKITCNCRNLISLIITKIIYLNFMIKPINILQIFLYKGLFSRVCNYDVKKQQKHEIDDYYEKTHVFFKVISSTCAFNHQ